jgi:hypothetical protein
VTWEPSFEEEIQNNQGLTRGEMLGPRRGTFELEGLWVGDAVADPGNVKRVLVGQSFSYEGMVFRVKRVVPMRGNREFLRVSLSGTAVEGMDGSANGGVTAVGTVFGNGPESGPSVDAYGVWSSTVMRRVRAPVLAAHIPDLGSVHPRFPFMKLQGVGEASLRRGFCEIPLIYKGLKVSPGPLRSRMSRTTSEEPIQTHPRYADMQGLDAVMDIIEALRRGDLRLGITPGDDKTDVFLTPLALELYARIMKGNEAYLASGETWTSVQYYSQAVSDNLNPGTIGTPTGSPPQYGGRNYLYTGLDLVEEGPSLIRAERTWLLSAPGGWDATIYG